MFTNKAKPLQMVMRYTFIKTSLWVIYFGNLLFWNWKTSIEPQEAWTQLSGLGHQGRIPYLLITLPDLRGEGKYIADTYEN